jgi:hypothetical protein
MLWASIATEIEKGNRDSTPVPWMGPNSRILEDELQNIVDRNTNINPEFLRQMNHLRKAGGR